MARQKMIRCRKCQRCVTRTQLHMIEHLILYHGLDLLREPARLAALARYGDNNHEELARELYLSVARRALEKLYGQ